MASPAVGNVAPSRQRPPEPRCQSDQAGRPDSRGDSSGPARREHAAGGPRILRRLEPGDRVRLRGVGVRATVLEADHERHRVSLLVESGIRLRLDVDQIEPAT